ncbi:ribonuclease P protein component [Candidatus Margulisiibacteriota bacterium]
MALGRIREKSDFSLIYKKGKQLTTGIFTVCYLPGDAKLKLGIIAGGKVGNAVKRNRAKRLLREAARRLWRRQGPAGQLVIIAKRAILQQKEPAIRAALESALKGFLKKR